MSTYAPVLVFGPVRVITCPDCGRSFRSRRPSASCVCGSPTLDLAHDEDTPLWP